MKFCAGGIAVTVFVVLQYERIYCARRSLWLTLPSFFFSFVRDFSGFFLIYDPYPELNSEPRHHPDLVSSHF